MDYPEIYDRNLGSGEHLSTTLLGLAILPQIGHIESELLIRRSLNLNEYAFGVNSWETTQSIEALCTLMLKMGRYNEAEPLSRKSITIIQNKFGKNSSSLITSLSVLARCLEVRGKTKVAEAEYRHILKICEHTLGPNHTLTAEALYQLSYNLTNQSR